MPKITTKWGTVVLASVLSWGTVGCAPEREATDSNLEENVETNVQRGVDEVQKNVNEFGRGVEDAVDDATKAIDDVADGVEQGVEDAIKNGP